MPDTKTVAVIVGSLRQGSFSKKIANAMAGLAPEGLAFDFVDLAGLSFYNQDLEATPPADWTAFRDRIRAADAVLFVTPEYNRSVPGVLKNAIDVGSRPYGHSVFSGKPAAIVSTSPGAMGGFGANHHLRQSLVFLGMPTMTQPEAYLGNAATMVGDDGKVAAEATRDFLAGIMKAFAAWIAKTAG